MWRRFRSDPVQRLRERLDSFGTTMEPRWVLDHEALMEARPLYDLLDGVSRRGASEREAEALFLLACLHWYRYQCLPAGSDGPDLIQAVGLTELLLSLAPERVPPSLLAMLRAHVSAGPGRDVGSGASARADPRPGSGIGASGAGAANTAGSGPSGSARSGTPPPGVRVPAARSTPEAELGAALFGQAVMLMAGAERSGDYRVADQAQALLERALVGTPSGAPERLHYLSALGRVHREQYLRLGRQRSLPAAIDAHRESLESTPAGDPERPTRLFNLGNVLGDRFEQAGDVAALDESIQLLGDAARAAPADAPVWLMARVNLAGQLRERWERRGEPADLDRAVDVLAQAVSVRADPLVLFTYATLASRRFVASGTDGDLDTAIEANRAALASGLSEEQGGLARVTLAGLVGERHERRKTPADLDAAIEAYRAAAAGPRLDGQDVGGLWQAEGKLLEARYALHRRADDLREAERLLRAAVDGTTDPEQRARVLCDLGYTLGRWHADLNGLATLRQAREVLTEAERLLPADHPSRPDLLNNLGDTLRDLADRAGEPELLELAVTKLREAAANPANPAKLPLYLSNLGLALQELFGRTQDLAILTDAMVVLRRAVAAAPPGNPDRMWGLFNLGSALNRRTELVVNAALPTDGATPEQARAAALTDAEQAVTLLREAAELAQREAEPEERVRIVRTLALSHLLRHQLTEDPAVLDEAVTLLRALADAAATSAGDRYRLLTNLGNALLIRFRTRRNAPDAREMLTAYRAAVAALPVDHPERTMCLSNLAVAVEEITHSTADATAPADATAQPAPDGPAPTARPPTARRHGAQRTRPPSFRPSAATCPRSTWPRRSARCARPPRSRRRRRCCGRSPRGGTPLPPRGGRPAAALAGYTTAIELPRPGGLARHGPRRPGPAARAVPGLAGDAAAVAIALDRPQRAVELLEYGRGVLLTRAHDAGPTWRALRARAPHLAERLAATQAALDRLVPVAGPTGPAPLGGPTAAVLAVAVRPADDEPGVGSERRHELAVQRREVLAEIRQLPDFGRFLRPPPFADLARAGEDGPVVLVNVADRRCDALLVSGGRVTTVPLPELSLGELQVRAAYFLTGLAEVTAPVGDPVRRRSAAGPVPPPDPGNLDWLWRWSSPRCWTRGPARRAHRIPGPPRPACGGVPRVSPCCPCTPPPIGWREQGPRPVVPVHGLAAGAHPRPRRGRRAAPRR
ncbi:hypothetical protein ENC19_18360 [Verrucosispora sp. CWR15]|uniref:Tetratricopeptide repeat protein n=1 Tax=Verrucosispora sioxanthis TaxID=2499994 RepID=A0A6M1L896_9ACTN|nr:hypothetical protein [Verrucosispora sioxanthis]NEE65375.1 hypothetical protein [Verrucosispora sioxanthis]NGM14485.1 hypothetical protein [Verrucosispora sioxanthis]